MHWFLAMYKSSCFRANRTCLIVLEDFEHFVRNSEKQEILYTLLDLLQSKDVRCCVVGFTSDAKIKMDFNKRVISRFSNKIWSISKAIQWQINNIWNWVYFCLDCWCSWNSSLDAKFATFQDLQIWVLKVSEITEGSSRPQRFTSMFNKDTFSESIGQDIFENESICFCVSDLRDIALLSASYARDKPSLSSADILQAMNECLKRFEIMVGPTIHNICSINTAVSRYRKSHVSQFLNCIHWSLVFFWNPISLTK